MTLLYLSLHLKVKEGIEEPVLNVEGNKDLNVANWKIAFEDLS